jgi:hypothetical protein
MRRWGLAVFLCLVSAAPAAFAQTVGGDVAASTDDAGGAVGAIAAPQEITYGAMPGGLHVPSAEVLPKGVAEISTLSGFGWRKGLLGADHRFGRAIGDIAFAYGITDQLSIGLSLDGRYDKHFGIAKSGDDGYVGDPHLNLRFAKPVGTLGVGAQLGVWVPGKDAPSIAAGAISVDARGLLSLAAGPGTLSFDVGFRYDNSAKSVDKPSRLSLQDRVSLGVSNFNALLAGAHLTIPNGKLWFSVESSVELFLGDPRTSESASIPAEPLREGSLLLRAGATAGFRVNDTWSVLAFVEGAKVPGILADQVMRNSVPLLPFEPIVTGGIGIEARFGGRHDMLIVDRDCHKTNTCQEVAVRVTADIEGTVVDAAQKPVVGAKVTVTLKNSQVAAQATDAQGKYRFADVPIGKSAGGQVTLEESGVVISVEVANMKPGKADITQIAQGTNTVPAIQLEPILPAGLVRVIVRAVPGGKPLAGATMSVSPGDGKATSDADGVASVEVPPGDYKITVKATGYATQELDAKVEPGGVVIKNAELHR